MRDMTAEEILALISQNSKELETDFSRSEERR